MKIPEKKILALALMLAVPVARETILMVTLAGFALAMTARSFEPKPAYAKSAARRKFRRHG